MNRVCQVSKKEEEVDRYSKVVLTIIAVCLVAITIKLWEPSPAYSGLPDKGPTWGDLLAVKNYPFARERLEYSIPLVKIHGTVATASKR